MSKHFAAVLGSPIAHSKSPQLHQAAYAQLGLDINYERIEVSQEQAKEFIAETNQHRANGLDICGYSVTMPLKATMVFMMDALDERVENLGVLNTIVFDDDGKSTGYNTDVDGIIRALRGRGGCAQFPKIAILGGGGTAAATIAACTGLATSQVTIFARNQRKVRAQLELAESFGLVARYRPLDEFACSAHEFDGVISTLPPRVADCYAVTLKQPVTAPLLDVAYDPWPSVLAHTWQEHGGTVVSGVYMLLYQAVEQVRLFTGRLLGGRETKVDWDKVTDLMAQAIGVSNAY